MKEILQLTLWATVSVSCTLVLLSVVVGMRPAEIIIAGGLFGGGYLLGRVV